MIELKPGPSLVLLKVSCMRMVGPLAQVGEVTLTEDVLRFSPRGLERVVGAEGFQLSVLNIDEMVQGRRFDSELRLRVGEDVHRFTGSGASFLAQRLRGLLLDPGRDLLPIEEYDREEPIVVCGDVTVYLHGMLGTRGQAILTDRRLRIRTTSGMESWILGKRYIDCQLLDVRSIERAGVRKALQIQTTDGKVAIGGDISGEIAAGLGATLIDAQVPGRWNQHVGLKSVFEAQLIRGPRYIPGVLAVSTRALYFSPTGRLDSAAGAPEVSVDLEDVFQVGLVGRGEPRLEIHTHEQVVALILEGSEQRFTAMVRGFQEMDLEPPLGHRPMEYITSSEVDCFLSGWSQELVPGESVLSLEWGIQWLDERTVMLGWMMLTNQRVLFLCSSGEGGVPDSHVFPIDEMGRLQDETDPTRLKFQFDGQIVEFTHRNGQEFVANFWELCNAPTRLRGSQASRQRRTLSRLDGVVSFLRVLKGNQEVFRVDEVRLVAEDEGLGVKLLPEEADLLTRLGSGLIEVGRREGIYRFDMRVSRVAALDEGEFRTGREKIIFVALSQVTLHNRREGFRIEVSFIVDVQFSGGMDKEAHNCVVEDLSIGGVALSIPWSVSQGAVAVFELPVLGEPLSVRARVVRLIQEGGGIRRWRYGLAFFGLEDVDKSRINQLVLDQQRKRLRN